MKEEQHKEIQDCLAVGDYISAERILSGIKDASNNDADYWYYLAHIFRKKGDLVKAEEFCKKALSLSPELSSANFELGIIHQMKGDYISSAKCIKKIVDSFTDEVSLQEKIDTLNSLALSYKKAKDTDNALKYYNLALEVLVQELYDWVKTNPTQGVNKPIETSETSTNWLNLAMQIAIKNTAVDGLEKALLPTDETAIGILKNSLTSGRVFHDEGKIRYILPAYFNIFGNALKQNIWYSVITNNIAILYAEIAESRKAGEVLMESISFIPEGSDYKEPIENFNRLKDEFGAGYWKTS